MIFIWVINLLGFLPLPLTGETWHHIPVWGIYAATSSLSVMLALSLMTFLFTHIEGIRYNGPDQVLPVVDPEVPPIWLPLIVSDRCPVAVHASDQPLGQALREHACRPHPEFLPSSD